MSSRATVLLFMAPAKFLPVPTWPSLTGAINKKCPKSKETISFSSSKNLFRYLIFWLTGASLLDPYPEKKPFEFERNEKKFLKSSKFLMGKQKSGLTAAEKIRDEVSWDEVARNVN